MAHSEPTGQSSYGYFLDIYLLTPNEVIKYKEIYFLPRAHVFVWFIYTPKI